MSLHISYLHAYSGYSKRLYIQKSDVEVYHLYINSKLYRTPLRSRIKSDRAMNQRLRLAIDHPKPKSSEYLKPV